MSETPYGERRNTSTRFLPPDPGVEAPYRLTPGLALRVGVLGVVALMVFAVLFFRLWSLQVLSGDTYLAAAQGNQLRTIRIEAPRGTILDRNGKPIVDNVAGTAVKLWVGDLPKQGRYDVIKRLAWVLKVPPARLAKEVDQRIADPLNPITVKTAVGEDQVAYLYEHQAEFPGVQIQQTYLRHYPHQTLAAQVLGYVGEVSEGDLDRRPKLYRSGDKVGKAGVEAKFDEFLRGEAGQAQIRVDSLGRPQGPLEPKREARPGHAVRLTIDIGLQRAAERALRYGIATARENESYYANGGALVALDPRDGAVLAMASTPTYKPSVYVGRVDPKKIQPLVNDAAAKKQNYPGDQPRDHGRLPARLDVEAGRRARGHAGAPARAVRVDRRARRRRRTASTSRSSSNWDPYVNHAMSLPEALARSCDTYFYDVGYRFYLGGDKGRTRMQEWARRFGFGAPAGIDVGREETGLVPTPAWRKRTFTSDWDKAWNPGDSIQLSIGQKDVAGDAAPDGALLRDDRQRRQAREAVRRVAGGDVGGARSGAGRRAPLHARPARVGRRRPRRAAGDPRRPLRRHALDVRHVVRRLLELPDRGRRARRARRRRSCRSRATRRGTSRTSRGGAATGRRRPRSRGSSSAR